VINSQSTNHHTSQRLSCFVSRYDAFSLSKTSATSHARIKLCFFSHARIQSEIFTKFLEAQRSASTIWFSAYFQTCFRREKKCGQSKNYYGSFSFQRLWNGCTKLRKLFVQIFLPVTFPFWKLLFFPGKEEAKLFSPLLIFSLTVNKSHGKWIFHSQSLRKVGGKRAKYF